MTTDRILITGSEGVIGSYCHFGNHLNKSSLDVTDFSAVMTKVLEYRPDIVIHLAALTDLTICERDAARAYSVNAAGTYHVALAVRRIGAKLVYVSTSGVFDGTKTEPYIEEDTPSPVNVYGRSKYLGELAVSGILQDYLIVRTSWLFGGGQVRDKKFVGKIMSQLAVSEVRAVEDRRGSPTYAKDLVQAIMRLLDEEKKGIYHMSNQGNATRFDVAKEIISLTGARAHVVPVRSDAFSSAYRTGENESMASRVTYMRPWREALAEYIRTEWHDIKTV